jgi:hypothetical protein
METVMSVALSAEDISNILITAFDGHYGGANYWVDNLDDDGTSFEVSVSKGENDEWLAVGLAPVGPDAGLYESKHVGGLEVNSAFNAILNGSLPIRSDLREQCVRSAAEDDLDIDADVADCIAQFCVFGELVYG